MFLTAGVLFFLLWFGGGILSALTAGIKGRSIFGWFLFGMIFPYFSFFVVLFLPSLKRSPEEEAQYRRFTSGYARGEIRRWRGYHCGNGSRNGG